MILTRKIIIINKKQSWGCAASQKEFLKVYVVLSSSGLPPGGRRYPNENSPNHKTIMYIPDQDAAQQQERERQDQP